MSFPRRWQEQAVWPSPEGVGDIPLTRLCALMQRAASAHANELAFGITQLHEQNRTWMLSRLLVHVRDYPEEGQPLRVTTWPSGVERLFALREFRMESNEGEVFALATSAWLLVDLATRRPLRPAPHVARFAVPERALEVSFEKLREPADALWCREYRVQPDEIDANDHVGSMAYIAWVERALRDARPDVSRISEFEMNYLAEVLAGDRVRVEIAPGEAPAGRLAVAVAREGAGGAVAVAAVGTAPPPGPGGSSR